MITEDQHGFMIERSSYILAQLFLSIMFLTHESDQQVNIDFTYFSKIYDKVNHKN